MYMPHISVDSLWQALPDLCRKEKPSNVQNPAANQQDIKSWILLSGEILSARQYRVSILPEQALKLWWVMVTQDVPSAQ